MIKILMIGIGGFIGSVLRYSISTFAYRLIGSDFPYGTLIVNILGSAAIGLFMGLVENGVVISTNIRVFIAVGILGGFTTFSSFSYETIWKLKQGEIYSALTNIFLNVLLCLGATWIGLVFAKYITTR
ncbi:MAG: fluoride efflux transporter CrcB [Candidatus Calescibacterium sp.]|nr:fluoride efflux transporter CrcB [Candidatus Calescibacterium sp.]MCX7734879.1 fluoride efflux transporter CrcB [bacterium]MDW8086570.1 fluoride efflux transporter CrcB [Candidatus Calescibacterium sp.]